MLKKHVKGEEKWSQKKAHHSSPTSNKTAFAMLLLYRAVKPSAHTFQCSLPVSPSFPPRPLNNRHCTVDSTKARCHVFTLPQREGVATVKFPFNSFDFCAMRICQRRDVTPCEESAPRLLHPNGALYGSLPFTQLKDGDPL
jgi:hypothetical protein